MHDLKEGSDFLMVAHLEDNMLADWFARKNIDDTIIFVQYLLLFLFKFVQLLTRIIHSNLEVCFKSAPS